MFRNFACCTSHKSLKVSLFVRNVAFLLEKMEFSAKIGTFSTWILVFLGLLSSNYSNARIMRFWVGNSEISPLPFPLKATPSYLLGTSVLHILPFCWPQTHFHSILASCFRHARARLFLFPSLRLSLSFSTLPRLICILFLSYIILLSRAFPLWENRYYFRSSSRSLLPPLVYQI